MHNEHMYREYGIKAKAAMYLGTCYRLVKNELNLHDETRKEVMEYLVSQIVRNLRHLNIINKKYNLGYAFLNFTEEVEGIHMFIPDKDIMRLAQTAHDKFCRVNAKRGIRI